MHRSSLFDCRTALYQRLDQEFSGRTRFFGAAALTNAVFAQLFTLLPHVSLTHGYHFLRDAGAALETANLQFARVLRRRQECAGSLDHDLVSREQKLMQTCLDACPGRPGERIRSELNGLLNDTHIASLFSGAFKCSRPFASILRNLRRDLGRSLDFADERHRVRIGMGVIQHIRHPQEHQSGSTYRIVEFLAPSGWKGTHEHA